MKQIKIKRGGRINVTIKLTADEASLRRYSDVIEKVDFAAVPLVTPDQRKRPRVVGTGTLVHYKDVHLLVTASHVIEDYWQRGLMTFGFDQSAFLLGQPFYLDKQADLAACRLTTSQILGLSHRVFLGTASFWSNPPTDNRVFGAVVGYPSTKSDRKDARTIDTVLIAFDGYLVPSPAGTVAIKFDKREGMQDGATGLHITPPDPHGMSGGPIFGFPTARRVILPGVPARLIGIAVVRKRKERTIEGPGADRLIAMIDSLLEDGKAA